MSTDIDKLQPGSGRYLKEGGGWENFGDWMRQGVLSCPCRASLDSRMFRTFWQGSVPNGTTYYFGFDIPADVTLVGVARYDTVIEGELDVTFGVATGLGAVQETLSGYNFDEVAGAAPQAVFKRYDGVTGFSARTPATRLYSPSRGPQRFPATQTESDVRPKYDNGAIPVLQFQNSSGSPVDLHTYLLWLELSG